MPFGMSVRQYKKSVLKRAMRKYGVLSDLGIMSTKEACTAARRETSDFIKGRRQVKKHSGRSGMEEE